MEFECTSDRLGSPDFGSLAAASIPAGITSLLLLLVAVLLGGVNLLNYRSKKKKVVPANRAPGPTPLPLLGSLHHLGETDLPYEGLTKLKEVYGDVFSLRLGTTDCVVVNTPELMDEAVVAKANDFDGRPDFERFRLLFGGVKDNSLAFCDFSSLHKKRRALISHYSLPHSHSNSWERMNKICQEECWILESYIEKLMRGGNSVTLDIKPILLKACGNIFNRYFCDSPHYDYDDGAFSAYVSAFEHVFAEVNTGRLCDFIPALTFTAAVPIMRARASAAKVREFVKEGIVAPRMQQCACGAETEQVLLDHLMPSINGESRGQQGDFRDVGVGEMDSDSALYALEDILGGHTAIACFAMRVMLDLLRNPETADRLRNEISEVESASLDTDEALYSMSNCERLHWGRAAMFESIRMTCSPIVPHRATNKTTLGGYDVEEDTVLFINNHELNMSAKYWGDDANEFRASRFLVPRGERPESNTDVDLVFRRPTHFAPFSIGKRACMGYKLIETITLVLIVALFKNYDISLSEEPKVARGQLALPLKPLGLTLKARMQ